MESPAVPAKGGRPGGASAGPAFLPVAWGQLTLFLSGAGAEPGAPIGGMVCRPSAP